MNKEIEVKKREWVKTALIVFLLVMFLLTLFSNTILNRSLPEVAAQYTQSATINSRIRGSGSVTANESFEVIAKQAHTVTLVNARLGDEVNVGDVLITLSQDGSAELEAAREQLRVAELELERFLITDSPYNNFAEFNRAIVNARSELSAAQQRQSQAQNRVTAAQNALNQARAELNAINYSDTAYQNALSSINNAKNALTNAATELEIAERKLETYEINNGGSAMPGGSPPWYENEQEYKDLVKAVTDARNAHTAAQNALDRLIIDTNFNALESARDNWLAATDKVAAANDAVSAANAGLADENRGVVSAQQSLDAASEALANAQRAAGTTDSLFDIELREKNRVIDELHEKIETLEKEGDISEITADVSGKVTAVNISAGQQTVPDTPLMVIEVTDMGYTLSISATVEQSSRVTIGDTAEVDTGWWRWGDPIRAVLTGIRPDPQNPQTGRLLVFSVSGDDVESGMQLNVTIAQRSENFGIVVPNSAIRTDTNGDFVLIIETRESPLRNRYIATRVDVNVIASDDINSAISGAGLSGWDFVITTSTRPIEAGMQVRMADN